MSKSDSADRQEVVSAVSLIVKTGKKVYSGYKGSRVITSKHGFLVEVISGEKDEAGRAAPIVYAQVYGTDRTPNKENLTQASSAIKKFATQIKRSVREQDLKEILSQF